MSDTCTGANDCSAETHIHGCFADNPCSHRGPGRPSTGTRVDIRIPAERLAVIDALAEHYGETRAVMIRYLIEYATNSDSQMVPQTLLRKVRLLEHT